MARNFAVVVGINNYKKIQPLKYAKSDAERMCDFFTQDLQVSPENLYFFSDDSPCDVWGRETQPTYSNLETFFTESFETPFLESGDTLWFYFSGHGMPYEGRDCLLPIDFSLSIASKTTIPLSGITDRLRRSGADNVVMLIDACRSDGAKNVGMGIGEEKQQGVITFFSCSPSQVSYEIDEIGQGAFTNVLLEALRIQGEENCATVERFANYLKFRVPKLTQRYKNYVQTPYVVIEPETKLHYILLPKFANLTDIALLRENALEAENEEDYDLAFQLWLRVNVSASGTDIKAIKAFQRLANKQSAPNSQLKERVSDRGGENNSSVVSLNPVALVSAKGIDYRELEKLLKAKEWGKADRETNKLMVSAVGKDFGQWLSSDDLLKTSCDDLLAIDRLWISYSDGLYGFSVQKQIYVECGGRLDFGNPISETWNIFCHNVAWQNEDSYVSYPEPFFLEDFMLINGHLPFLANSVLVNGIVTVNAYFFSLIATCEA